MTPIDVQITAEASCLGINGREDPITFAATISPDAGAHGPAIVRALRHAADVAANRLGLTDQAITVPHGIDRALSLLAPLAAAGNAPALEAARLIAAEHGCVLRGPAWDES